MLEDEFSPFYLFILFKKNGLKYVKFMFFTEENKGQDASDQPRVNGSLFLEMLDVKKQSFKRFSAFNFKEPAA